MQNSTPNSNQTLYISLPHAALVAVLLQAIQGEAKILIVAGSQPKADKFIGKLNKFLSGRIVKQIDALEIVTDKLHIIGTASDRMDKYSAPIHILI